MTIVQIKENSIDSIINQAKTLLDHGKLVAIPTETVYGLAGDACNDAAVRSIYQTKGRPSHNPLICHVSSIEMAETYVHISAAAKSLMQHFWPGPLTFVLPRKIHQNQTDQNELQIAQTVHTGLDSLAVRCPDTAITRGIITALGRPIAAPSANPSGKLSPTTAQDVVDGFGGTIPLIIDGGHTVDGIESTIIKVLEHSVEILRPGSITAAELKSVTPLEIIDFNSNTQVKTIIAPGQLTSHYAPNATLLIGESHYKDGDCFIAFGANPKRKPDFNLSATGNLKEAAHNLFSMIRLADKALYKQQTGGRIILATIPNEAIGIAINDRMARAAAPSTATPKG